MSNSTDQMEVFALRLPASIHKRLQKHAKKTKDSKSEIARRGIITVLDTLDTPKKRRTTTTTTSKP